MATEAWILRNLVFISSRAIKRGYRPKEIELRSIMEVAGVPIPEQRPRGLSGSALESILVPIVPFVGSGSSSSLGAKMAESKEDEGSMIQECNSVFLGGR